MDVSTLLEDEDIAAAGCFAECVGYAGKGEGSRGSTQDECAWNYQGDVVAGETVVTRGYCYIVSTLYCYRLAREVEGARVGGEEVVCGGGRRVAGEQELAYIGVEFEGAEDRKGGWVAGEGKISGGCSENAVIAEGDRVAGEVEGSRGNLERKASGESGGLTREREDASVGLEGGRLGKGGGVAG